MLVSWCFIEKVAKMEKKIVAKVLPKKSVRDFENVVENSHIWKKNRNHPVGLGGFQLKFVCISWVINHMTCVIILSALIGGFFKNPLPDLLSSLNFDQ